MMRLFYALMATVCFLSSVSFGQQNPPQETALDRFLRYAKIDTQSAEDQTTVPSTKKQFNLANLLSEELKKLDVQNVRVSEYAIVYGMIPGNLPDNSKVPTIGFISHMDTSPAVSGENVKVRHHPQSGWLDECGRLKADRPC